MPSSLVNFYGQDAGIELAGKWIFLVHYLHYAQALATTGDWDIVCCGHDHCAAVTTATNIKGGESLVVNPGTSVALRHRRRIFLRIWTR